MLDTGYVAQVFLRIDLAAERAIALLLLKCDRSFFGSSVVNMLNE
ncbi:MULTISPECIES: hypothetical protein [unclassified Microcoleus]